MKKGREMINKIQVNKLIFIIPLFFFLIVFLQMTKLSLSTTVDGVDLKRFASNRNTKSEILYANRGTIYTADGAILAQNIDSYTVIAYLSPKRDDGSKKPKHVVDKEGTAKSLAPIINMSENDILKLLNKSNLYQVELRPGGKDITEIKKEEIEALNLPGIDFIQTFKRYYPNNDFLSYTLGYVRSSDDSKITGEMGIEKYYNKQLSGKDGSLEYQKDLNGYQIPNTPEIRDEQKDGDDIYLTIDDNIQMFTERAIKDAYNTYHPDWVLGVVADAKTGKILGVSSSPSFDPNVKNIDSYLNPLVSYTFEPGSTMKTFSYMTALEKGIYDGNATFQSGHITIDDATISDWNRTGWGTITFDQGYALSSNVGAASMIDRFINKNDLLTYYKKLGFGKMTGITLPNELNGRIDFKYKVEVANAAFGQGITTTPIQFIQALTSISNDGIMLRPYIVDKIVDPDTKKVVYQGGRAEIGRVASSATIEKIKSLMYNVINGEPSVSTGYIYKVDGYDIIGKTGTAQYVDPTTGKYYTGDNDYIRSFAGMFPKNNPQIIIYTVMKKPSFGAALAVSKPTVKLIKDIGKYLNINQVASSGGNIDTNYVVPNFVNQNISALDNITHSFVKIGNGNKIIAQYPQQDVSISANEHMFILTNDSNVTIAAMASWSGREVEAYCKLINRKCNIQGTGYVVSQDLPAGINIKDVKEINVGLNPASDKVNGNN